MKHASHKAAKSSRQHSIIARELFVASKGSHSARVVRASKQAAAVAVPMTRRELRKAAKAKQRRNNILASSALAALLATGATALAVANPSNGVSPYLASSSSTSTVQVSGETGSTTNTVSRSELRTELTTVESGEWSLGSSDLDVNLMSRSASSIPAVAALMDEDYEDLPSTFNANHSTGDSGNAYPWGQCTWYVYQRRAELGLPTASHFGNGGQWGSTAAAMGYWVDHTARHQGDIISFLPGQANADWYYGHVAVVEKINKDGSIEISESNVKGLGVISTRTFTAKEAAQFTYIHY